MKENSEAAVPCTTRIPIQPLQAGPRDPEQEPRTANQKYLAALLEEVIGLERGQLLLPHKFLDVGGNSLTLNIVLTRIEAETGASMEPELFFDDERSSLFALAQQLDTLRPAESARSGNA